MLDYHMHLCVNAMANAGFIKVFETVIPYSEGSPRSFVTHCLNVTYKYCCVVVYSLKAFARIRISIILRVLTFPSKMYKIVYIPR